MSRGYVHVKRKGRMKSAPQIAVTVSKLFTVCTDVGVGGTTATAGSSDSWDASDALDPFSWGVAGVSSTGAAAFTSGSPNAGSWMLRGGRRTGGEGGRDSGRSSFGEFGEVGTSGFAGLS